MAIYLGQTAPSNFYVGASAVSNIYLGNTLVWANGEGPDITLVEYIRTSNSGPYIDTGYTFNASELGENEEFYIYFEGSHQYDYSCFGLYQTMNLTGSNDQYRFYAYDSSTRVTLDRLDTYSYRNKLEFKNGSLTWNNRVMATGLTKTSGGQTGPIYLFARYKQTLTQPDDSSFGCSVYRFKIGITNTLTDETTLVRDMVPCVYNPTQKPGMYDYVEGVFYGNANRFDPSTDFSIPT